MNPELERLLAAADAAIADGVNPGDVRAALLARTNGKFGDVDELRRAVAKQDAQAARGRLQAAGEGTGKGMLRSALQGATFGFGDEITGGLAALDNLVTGSGATAVEGRAQARQGVNQFREAHPVGSIATEAAGGAALGLLGAGRAIAAGTGRAAARGLLASPLRAGAASGAVAGAGEAEGGVADRALGATAGAVTGGAIGGLLGLGGRVLRGPVSRARGRIADVIERTGESVQDLVGRARPGETLMDLSRPALELAEAAVTIPSRGAREIREALVERSAAAPSRITGELQQRTGLTFENAVETMDDLVARRRANAAPLYERAYQQSAPASVLSEEIRLPRFQQAYEAGRRIAATEGVQLPQLFRETGGMHGPRTLEFLDVESIPVQAIDYMKRGLDDLIEGQMRGGSMGRTEARALRNRLREVLGRVDEAVPDYAAARAQFAGDEAVRGAFERGQREFLRLDPRQLAREIRGMADSEQEFFRRGALDAVRAKLEKSADGRDLSRVLFGNTEMRRRLRLLFPDDASYRQFADAMIAERNMAATQNAILGNSRTAARLAGQADIAGPRWRASDLLHPINTGGRILDEAVTPALQGLLGAERTVNEIAPLIARQLQGGTLSPVLDEFLAREARRRGLLTAGAQAAGVAGGLLSNR